MHLKKYRREALFFVFGLLIGLAILAYLGCDDVDADSEGISGEFELASVPLLPGGFPLYPKSFYAGGIDNLEEIEDVTEDVLDEIFGFFGAVIPDEIENFMDFLFAARHPIYDPGPLSMSVNQQIASIFMNAITIEEATLDLEITNDTDQWWGVPIAFSLYVGNAEDVFAATQGDRSAALVRTDESDECNCTFVLKAGETKAVTTENLEGLVNALNDLHSLAIDYDADIYATELSTNKYLDLLDTNLSKISRWKLTIGDFKLNISGRGELSIPDEVPDWVLDLL